jgi:dTDP-4-dehydrorhamnose 3,5-epimerase
VPKNFGHGYLTLTDDAEVTYLVTQFYQPGAESGLRWDDPAFGLRWPQSVDPELMSEKDRSWPDYRP